MRLGFWVRRIQGLGLVRHRVVGLTFGGVAQHDEAVAGPHVVGGEQFWHGVGGEADHAQVAVTTLFRGDVEERTALGERAVEVVLGQASERHATLHGRLVQVLVLAEVTGHPPQP